MYKARDEMGSEVEAVCRVAMLIEYVEWCNMLI